MTKAAADGRTMPAAGMVLVLGSVVGGLLLSLAAAELPGSILFVAYAGIGAFLAIRRPGNSIGWLLMLIGWGLALGSFRVEAPIRSLLAGELDPRQAFAAWANGSGWTIAFLGFFGICVTFPSGHLPPGRAGLASRILTVAIGFLAVALVFGPTTSVILTATGAPLDVPNPYALAPDAPFWSVLPPPTQLVTAAFVVVVVAFVGLFLRYRRSAGVERLQYRWLAAAVAVVAVATLTWAITVVVLRFPQGSLATVAVV